MHLPCQPCISNRSKSAAEADAEVDAEAAIDHLTSLCTCAIQARSSGTRACISGRVAFLPHTCRQQAGVSKRSPRSESMSLLKGLGARSPPGLHHAHILML